MEENARLSELKAVSKIVHTAKAMQSTANVLIAECDSTRLS